MKNSNLVERANKVLKDVKIGMDMVKSCQTHNIARKRFLPESSAGYFFRGAKGYKMKIVAVGKHDYVILGG